MTRTLLVVNERRQVMSQDVLSRTQSGLYQDTKPLKTMTKSIVDRFFNSSMPPAVQV